MGDLGGGHYVAECNVVADYKNNGSWYRFDDSKVTASGSPASRSSAYVLFYSRKD
jgi:ubiquitin C-terminal hydrolase